jgi:hypothetical protein
MSPEPREGGCGFLSKKNENRIANPLKFNRIVALLRVKRHDGALITTFSEKNLSVSTALR